MIATHFDTTHVHYSRRAAAIYSHQKPPGSLDFSIRLEIA
jgi:hypothetical protein